MAEGKGGVAGGFRAIFLGVEEGGSSDRRFIMRHDNLPYKELYATIRMVDIKEGGPKE